MSQETPGTPPNSNAMVWTGWVISGLMIFAMVASGVLKVAIEPQVEELGKIGWKTEQLLPLAITEIACAIVYAIPQTAVLGAVLLTGYLGGAIATHVRIGDAFVVQAILGVLVWLGLWFRDPRIRALLPFRR
jgi:hypothetical protein